MTAPSIFMGFALAGLGSLLVSTGGYAETRLISDPSGGLVAMAPTDGLHCCWFGDSTSPDASAAFLSALPTPAAAIGASTDPLAGSGVAQAGPTAYATVPFMVEPNFTTAPAPQSGWSKLLSTLVELGGAASR
jgi:hypothetical protein